MVWNAEFGIELQPLNIYDRNLQKSVIYILCMCIMTHYDSGFREM